MAGDCQEAFARMSERQTDDQDAALRARNRHAREVIAGNDIQLSHRASNVVPGFQPRAASVPRTLPKAGTPAQTGYLGALMAITLASLALYLILDFESASIGLFILSLVLMAGWFVFSSSAATDS